MEDAEIDSLVHAAISGYFESLAETRLRLTELADGRRVVRLNISHGYIWAIIEDERMPVKVGPIGDGSLEDLLYIDAGRSPNLD